MTKIILVIALTLLFAWPLMAADAKPAAKDDKKSSKMNLAQERSYVLGQQVGTEFKDNEIDIDPKFFAKGIEDALKGHNDLTEAESTAVMQGLAQEMQLRVQNEAARFRQGGQAFMEANKSKPGVVSTASGLQYIVLAEGKGNSPQPQDKVTVHYRGTLVDGTEFDSSYKRGEPAVLQVNRVIPGWQEALGLMKEGDKWQVFIPQELGYGAQGAGQVIPPYAVLIFEMQLLKVN